MFRLTILAVAVTIAALMSASSAIAVASDDNATAVCKRGGYLDLFPQDGNGTLASPSSMFDKQADCLRWIREGGAVGELRAELIPGPSTVGYPGTWMALWFTVSGASTTGGCWFDPSLPYALSVDFGGGGGACIGPFTEDVPFEAFESQCQSPDQLVSYKIFLATSSGGVVSRTVETACP